MEHRYINEIVKLSLKSYNNDEFPVGAIVVCDNKIISRGYNNRNKSNITCDHAEVMAITKANKKLNSWRLSNCDMYVTLEPCEMCKKIIAEARIIKVYYLVSRSLDKYQFKGTKFEKINNILLENNKSLLTKHENMISKFFVDKR